MKPQITIYAVLFSIGLILAYFASIDGQDQAARGQRWLNLKPGDLNKIVYRKLPDEEIILTKLEDKVFWATQTKEGELVESFKASPAAKKFIEDWSSLQVIRVIGDGSSLDLADYGLEEPGETLQLRYNDQDFHFSLGKRSFQSPNIFVLDQQKNQVVMLPRQLLSPFHNLMAELFERSFHGIDLEEVGRIEVHGKDQVLTLLASQNNVPGEHRWLRDDEREDASASAWMNRIFGLQIRSYESPETRGDFDQWDELMRFRIYSKSSSLLDEFTLRVSPPSLASGENIKYRLRSQFTYSYVGLVDNRVQTLVDDYHSLF